MIVAFASNQVMFAKGDGSGTGTIESITTDPVPMNGMNQASAILNVHCYLDASPAQSPQLTVTGQVSNDGVNWVDTAVVVTASGTGRPVRGSIVSSGTNVPVESSTICTSFCGLK